MRQKQLNVTDLASLAEQIHQYTKTNWELYFIKTIVFFKGSSIIPPPTSHFQLKKVQNDALVIEDILKGAFPNRNIRKIITDIAPIILNYFRPEQENLYLINYPILNSKKNRSHRLKEKVDSLTRATDSFQKKLSQLTNDPEVRYFFEESGIASPEETGNLWLALQRFRVRISNGHKDTLTLADTLKTPKNKYRIEQTVSLLSSYFENIYQGKGSKTKNIKAQLSFERWLIHDKRLFPDIDSSIKLQSKDKTLQPDDFIDHLVYQFIKLLQINNALTTSGISKIRKSSKIDWDIKPLIIPDRPKPYIIIPEIFNVIDNRTINELIKMSLKEMDSCQANLDSEINQYRTNFYTRLKERIESLPNCQPTSNFKGLKVTDQEMVTPSLPDESSGTFKLISPPIETRALKYVEWKLESLKK